MGAVNRPEPALWITLVAIPVNAGLAYVLIYGGFGLPALDLMGAGLATALVDVGMCAAAIWIAYTRHPSRSTACSGASGDPTGRCSPSWWRSACRSRARCCWSTGCLRPPRC